MQLGSYEGSWCAIYVKHNHEFSTARLLAEKGYEVFSPSYVTKRRWSDRWKEVVLPVFAGYVFWRIKSDGAAPIMMTPGVVRILGTAKAPSVIPDSEINGIQAAIESGCNVQPCGFVDVGSRVRISGGPLDGFEGIVEKHRNHHAVVLSVGLVRSSVVVSLENCVLLHPIDTPAIQPWATELCAAQA
jgi:transcriptional antiterminator NusG